MRKQLRSTLFLLFTALMLPLGMSAQSIYNQDFVPPLDIPLYLTGTFGELRTNHFHAGIDIKTQGREGLPIKSIDNGYVSRIKISLGGYGKALYITHPDGFVSVYGHLQRFNDSITKYIQKVQYDKESYEVEVYPEKNELPVKKGEVIALSGNTGGSMGPHLHFEIREEATQYSLNPLLFEAIKVKDFYRPKIVEMAVYPVDSNSFINGKQDTLFLEVAGWGEQHRLKNQSPIRVRGRVSFGLLTHDVMNDLPNKNGVYEVKLMYDSLQIFGLKQNRLSFATARYINSLVDYGTFIKTNKRFIRTQIDTNNMLFNYEQVANNGILQPNDSAVHTLTWLVTDAYHNLSTLPFLVQSDTSAVQPKRKPHQKTPYHIRADRSFDLNTEKLRIDFPANAFYRSFYFDYEELAPDSAHPSTTYRLHNNTVPVQKSFAISIVPDTEWLSKVPSDKVYLAYSDDGKNFYYSGGSITNGRMQANSRSLGYYTLRVDTIAPTIGTLKMNKDKSGKLPTRYQIKIDDKQTGISAYRALLNKKWVLMEYETKKDLLFYEVDERLKKGENTFELEVTDQRGNKTSYKTVITR